MKGAIAKKIGMSQYISPETGKVSPVTVLQVLPADVLQIKTQKRDGYSAIVLGAAKRNKGKAAGKLYKCIREFPFEEGTSVKKGDQVGADALEGSDVVKLSSTSKGRGFSGVIKRHNFSRGPETHGSNHHREPGSVGMCAKPGRVLKGTKLPGHYGTDRTTLREVRVIEINKDQNLVVVEGPVPGSKSGYVTLIGSSK